MVIASLIIDFDLPFVESLKGRRKYLNSMKDKLKKFNISILDISSNYPKEASLAIVFLATNKAEATKIENKLISVLERNYPEIDFIVSKEIL